MTCVVNMDATSPTLKKEYRRKQKLTPGSALKASLQQAAAQKRLTVGLDCSISKLKWSPDTVKVCLVLQPHASLATDSKVKDRVGHVILHTLLRAFCTENHIALIHVVANASLMRLAGQMGGKMRREVVMNSAGGHNALDCSILLIEHGDGPASPEDLLWSSCCKDGHLDTVSFGQLPSD